MLRRSLVVIPILALALAACGTVTRTRDAGAPAVAPAKPMTEVDCPARPTRRFAKTRFVTNAGLAAGAFHRYIYRPLHGGQFAHGAHGRKRSMAKAALAGVFALDQLRRAKINVQANPRLCRTLSAPISNLSSSISRLTTGVKGGNADPSQVNATSGMLEHFRSQAGNQGVGFQDKNVPPSLVGG